MNDTSHHNVSFTKAGVIFIFLIFPFPVLLFPPLLPEGRPGHVGWLGRAGGLGTLVVAVMVLTQFHGDLCYLGKELATSYACFRGPDGTAQ